MTLSMSLPYANFDDAWEAFQVALSDVARDQGTEEASDDAWHDICQAVMQDCTLPAARELGRVAGVIMPAGLVLRYGTP
jgi:hypothetical protein